MIKHNQTQKSLAFLYTNNEKTEREIKETIPFTTAMKRIKHLGINLPKETKDLYIESYYTPVKEINDDTNRWREIYHVLDRKHQYYENDYSPQSNLQIQCNHCQITNEIFHRIRAKIFTICMETQETLNSQSSLEKEEWSWSSSSS